VPPHGRTLRLATKAISLSLSAKPSGFRMRAHSTKYLYMSGGALEQPIMQTRWLLGTMRHILH
jgi:hypothetical protein